MAERASVMYECRWTLPYRLGSVASMAWMYDAEQTFAG
jgi:hypothetical protein